jgi:xylulokinase
LFLKGINFNIHTKGDVLRAAQEGIVFSYEYGMNIMRNMGMNIQVISAGNANMFLSSIFRQTLSSISNAVIELYDTDGAAGAARAAGLGVGFYAIPTKPFQH